MAQRGVGEGRGEVLFLRAGGEALPLVTFPCVSLRFGALHYGLGVKFRWSTPSSVILLVKIAGSAELR